MSLLLTSLVDLEKLFKLSKPDFPHQEKKKNEVKTNFPLDRVIGIKD